MSVSRSCAAPALLALLAQVLPVSSRPGERADEALGVELAWWAEDDQGLCPAVRLAPGGVELRPQLMLILREPASSSGSQGPFIRDIKAQEVLLAQIPDGMPLERVEAYLRGWAYAMGQVLGELVEPELLMPSDLVFPQVLHLRRARQARDFERALMTRSRLGRLCRAPEG